MSFRKRKIAKPRDNDGRTPGDTTFVRRFFHPGTGVSAPHVPRFHDFLGAGMKILDLDIEMIIRIKDSWYIIPSHLISKSKVKSVQ
jgi:hypothetical protein